MPDDRAPEYHAVRGDPYPPFEWLRARRREIVLAVGYRFLFHLLSRPFYLCLLRRLFALLRWISPIARVSSLVIPTRHADIREALTRPHDLNTAEGMVPRLPMGAIVQAIDWPERHRAERAAIETAFAKTAAGDYAALRTLVRARLAKQLPPTVTDNEIDIASALTEEVALDVAISYFGVGSARHLAPGSEREHLRRILRLLASQIFRAPPKGSKAAGEVQFAKQDLLTLAMEAADVAGAIYRPGQTDTVLAHMLAQARSGAEPWLTEDWAIRNAASLSVFGTATTARALTQAILWILRKGGAEQARAAAQAYHAAPNDPAARDRLRLIALEGLRFNPMLPILGARACLRPTALSLGTENRVHLAPGQTVLPAPLAAMFDPEVFPCPNAFRPEDRNEADYLHFGHGPHICVGRRQAEIQFEETLGALFLIDNLSLEDCRITYDGPAVHRLRVRYDA